MGFFATRNDNSPMHLFFEDWGTGPPVILIHGWPLSHEMWEKQLLALCQSGYRCIAYDRRGFGKSDKPWDDYDYNSLADDLHALMETLQLRDVTLVGFSMGGGEVARYLSRYGSERISKAVLVSAVTPILMQTSSNPGGVPRAQFDTMVAKLNEDRPAFLGNFGKQFYGQGLIQRAVSTEVLDWTRDLALRASPKATIDCIWSFAETDFHADLKKFDVPTLVIHGDADATVPYETTGKLAAQLIRGAKLSVFEGAPHGLFLTHADQLNSELLSFLGRS